MCVCAWLVSCVQPFVTPGTVAHQAPLYTEILQARILEWVAMPYSRGSSQPRDQTLVFPVLAGRFFTTSSTYEELTQNWDQVKAEKWLICPSVSLYSLHV